MSTSSGRKRSLRVPLRRPFVSSLYARTLRCEQLEDRRLLAQLTVTTDQDIVDLNDGVTSLREAIFAANIVPGADEIVFDFGHDGPATILLTQGELAITDALTITGPGAELLTIDASGSDPTPDENNGDGSRVFNITSTTAPDHFQVFLAGLTLTGGDYVTTGGAIHSGESLHIKSCVLTGNSSIRGGAIFSSGPLEVVDSTISGNVARPDAVYRHLGSYGGGIHAGELQIVRSVIEGNTARVGAGVLSGHTSIEKSSIVGNQGPGIYQSGYLSMIDSVIANNTASGLSARSEGSIIRNSTISGNGTDGIMAITGELRIEYCTITENGRLFRYSGGVSAPGFANEVRVHSSIIAGNFNRDVDTSNNTNSFVSEGYNRVGIGDAMYVFTQPTDRHGIIDPLLGPLADNGGPTLTHALLPGSPAINAGDPVLSSLGQFDQRGEPFKRVFAGRADSGAYEQQSFVVNTLADEMDGDYGPERFSLREAIYLANSNVGADTIEFSPALASGTIMLTIGSLSVKDAVQIVGLGAEQLTIDNSLTQGPIFDINDQSNSTVIEVSLSGMTLTGSKSSAVRCAESLTVDSMVIRDNEGRSGGGISMGTGNFPVSNLELIIRNSILTGNKAQLNGGAISVYGPSVIIENSRFENNTSERQGGAVSATALGSVIISDSDFAENQAHGGGAIYALCPELILTRSELVGNTAVSGSGGGILADARTTISDSVISGNKAINGYGGGLYHTRSLTLIDTEVVDNLASGPGGGIYSFVMAPYDVVLQGSTIAGNKTNLTGTWGGGIAVNLRHGKFTLRECTVANNESYRLGGGIHISGGEAVIENSTISGNTAVRDGGGIGTYAGTNLTVLASTVTNNSAEVGGGLYLTLHSNLNLANSIIAANFSSISNPALVYPDLRARSITASYSLISSNAGTNLGEAPVGSPDSNGNLIGGPVHGIIDPLLGPLADNGGPTLTHALLPGSPAINAGDPSPDDLTEFDQRGEPFKRVFGGRVDIGAYERQTFVVDTLVDESDGDYGPGDLSLREAINLANSNVGADTIEFSPELFASGPATLSLSMIAGKDSDNEKVAFFIADDLTILGPGANLLAIDASDLDISPGIQNWDGARVFYISDGDDSHEIDVRFEGLTVSGGDIYDGGGAILSYENLVLLDVALENNFAWTYGGALYVRQGNTIVSDSVVRNNTALWGGGIAVDPSAFESSISLHILESAIEDNHSRYDGAGVHVNHSNLTITRSQFSSNALTVSGYGGGVFVEGTPQHPLSIAESTFTENRSGSGGGFAVFGSQAIVTSSTISGNRTGGAGGGIMSRGNTLVIKSSTITNNSASLNGLNAGFGGGIRGDVVLENSIVTANSDGTGVYDDIAGSVIAHYSLLGLVHRHTSQRPSEIGPTNIRSTTPFLGPLADNGGPTLTHALLPGSPAINAGDPSPENLPEFDQRGEPFKRVFGGRIDIGAYERQSYVVDTLVDESDGNYGPGDLSLREAINLANSNVGADTIEFSPALASGTIMLKIGSLPVKDAVQIVGLGAEQLTIDNSLTQGPIFDLNDNSPINGNIDVALLGMTLTGSTNSAIRTVENLSIDDMIFRGNSGLRGGGIVVERSGDQVLNAKLTVRNSLFEGNHATSTTALSAGGGILFNGRSGELTIENTIFVGNSSGAGGGGLGVSGFSNLVNITDSQFIENEAARGGGIFIADDNSKVATLTRVEVRDNTAGPAGGGIYVTSKPVTILDSQIVSNRTTSNSGQTGGGGGIFKQGGDAFLVLNSTISENDSFYDGGGILLQSSGLQLSDSILEQNTAQRNGGGISLQQGATVEINRSTLSGNMAQKSGGGLYSRNNTNLRFFDSTVSGNSANESGGGLYVIASGFLLRNSTVSGNEAGKNGGGLLVGQGTRQTTIEQSTITDNTSDADENGAGTGGGLFSQAAPAINISHTIIAGNHDNTGAAHDVSGNIASSYSLIGVGAEFLGPLADNGGPTLTHALLPGSPAINAGDPAISGLGQFDQRGYPFERIFGSAIDIGAFEAQSLVVDTLVDENDGDYSTGDFSLREAIELANQITGANTIEFSPQLAGGTILMTMGEYAITDAVEIVGLGAGELTIDASGNDPTPEVNNGDGSKIFNIDDGKSDSLVDVSIIGFTLTGADGSFNGGAIFSYENLTVAASIVRDNSARTGAAIFSQAGTVTSEDSSFIDNEARDRSAIFARGSVRLVDSTLTGNKSANNNTGSTITAYGFTEILNSEISHNLTSGSQAQTAAIDARGGFSLIDSTIASNTNLGGISGFTTGINQVIRSTVRDNDGVGISSQTGNTGKGIYIIDSTVTGNRNTGISIWHVRGRGDIQIIRTTISDNVGGGWTNGIPTAGGATLYVMNGANILIDDCTITDNIANTLGRAVPNINEGGGGLRIQAPSSAITITRTLVARNAVDNSLGSNAFGGGISIAAATTLISDSQIIDNTADGAGGGIMHMSGIATVVRTEIAGNSATDQAGGIYSVSQNLSIRDSDIFSNTAGDGGGIVADNLNITRSTISNNHALSSVRIPQLFPGRGGGIVAAGSATSIQIVECVIEGNTAIDAGGGIYAFRGLNLVGSTVVNNEASAGGGLWVKNGVITQSTISTNHAVIGAGIYADNTVVKYSTVAFNVSSSLGGGIFVAGSPLTLNHSIVARNSGTNPDITGLLGSVITAMYSLIRSNTGSGLTEAPVGSPDANGNIIGGGDLGPIDPLLGPLADNGGPTLTHALLPGSPAINAGDPTPDDLPEFDQRGEPYKRVFGGRIDIGAYERQSFVVDTLVDESDGNYGPGDLSLREAINLANSNVGADTIEFSPALAGRKIMLEQGELAIADAVEIVGLGAELLTVDAQQHSRIFNITATAGDFAFSGMTLTRGSTSELGSSFGGGAIHSASTGLLSLDGMRFFGNRTQGNGASGGAVYAAGNVNIAGSNFTSNQTFGSNAGGGAINAMGLVMANSNVSANSTNASNAPGGGINIGMQFGSGSPSSITDSIVTDNYTLGMSSHGDGISSSAPTTIERSKISGNFTVGGESSGGGLLASTAMVSDCLFDHNRTYGSSAPGGGGAAGNTDRPNWQVVNSVFNRNETLGTASVGGALAVGSQLFVSGSTFQSNNAFASGGGAVYIGHAGGFTASIATSSFTNNTATFGGAVASSGNLQIADSLLSGNHANSGAGSLSGGGAIHQSESSVGLTILHSKVVDNEAGGTQGAAGGGIRALGRATITQSEISGNRVIGPGAQGGGVFIQGRATINDSTVSGNQVVGANGKGGGIYLASANLWHVITNSTISGNQVTGDQTRGGGLYTNGRILIQHSTITGNRINSSTGEAGGLWVRGYGGGGPTGATVAISHSIVAGNFVGTTASDLRSGPILSYSLVGTNAGTQFVEAPVGSPDANGNLIGGPLHGVIDPLLGPLADNGGPTKTHALLAGSPAIDAGLSSSVGGANGTPLFDQRGAPFARVAGGRIDIGAYESQPATGLFNADFDGDGDVDGRDFLTWQRGYGHTSGATPSDGDATVDGMVDGNDLLVWQGTYGTSIAELGMQNAESRVPAPVQAMSSLLVLPLKSTQEHGDDASLAEHSAFRNPQSEFLIDRAFDHWQPPRRFTLDFGDLVTQRPAKRRAHA